LMFQVRETAQFILGEQHTVKAIGIFPPQAPAKQCQTANICQLFVRTIRVR
jgi:hypothetical protein